MHTARGPPRHCSGRVDLPDPGQTCRTGELLGLLADEMLPM
jgi:hypothetical protein